jgi:hypothetical protein
VSVLSSQPSYAVLDEPRAPAGKLIVVVTEQDLEQIDSSSLIWGWAAETGSDVLLLGLLAHEDEEPSLRRHLVSLAAAIRDNHVSVDIRVQRGENWIKSIKALWRPGDLLACCEGEDAGDQQGSLDQALRSVFEAPVYLLPAVTDARERQPTVMAHAVSLSGSMGVVIGFFLLQVVIVRWLHDWVQTALLSVSIMFEIALIWIWDSLTA